MVKRRPGDALDDIFDFIDPERVRVLRDIFGREQARAMMAETITREDYANFVRNYRRRDPYGGPAKPKI